MYITCLCMMDAGTHDEHLLGLDTQNNHLPTIEIDHLSVSKIFGQIIWLIKPPMIT